MYVCFSINFLYHVGRDVSGPEIFGSNVPSIYVKRWCYSQNQKYKRNTLSSEENQAAAAQETYTEILIFLSTSQEISREHCLQNNLFCVDCRVDVKQLNSIYTFATDTSDWKYRRGSRRVSTESATSDHWTAMVHGLTKLRMSVFVFLW